MASEQFQTYEIGTTERPILILKDKGLFWFSFWPSSFKFKLGEGPEQRLVKIGGIFFSKEFQNVILKNASTAELAKRQLALYRWLTFTLLTLLCGGVSILTVVTMDALSSSRKLLHLNPQTQVSVLMFTLIVGGAMQLHIMDMYRFAKTVVALYNQTDNRIGSK